MQLIGPNTSIFATQLGILVRCGSRLPINIISWAKILSSNRDNLWQEIKENTNAPEEYKDTCMMKVGDIWKKWKAEVKKMHFSPYEDDSEKLAEFPGDNRLMEGSSGVLAVRRS